jgi:predicted O-methyltransferase YrrM
MFNQIKFIFKYINYYISARHIYGHGIHSPFLFQLVKSVFYRKDDKKHYLKLFEYLKSLKKSKATIEINDKGAGSLYFRKKLRRVSEIAFNSSTKPKYGKLISKLVEYLKPLTIIELGTCLGIGTSYLCSKKMPNCKLYTIEGSENLSSYAKENCVFFKEKNLFPITGNFDMVLPDLLDKLETVDLVYIDGNHRKEPTIRYFELLLQKINNNSVLIFDDIHWSDEMEEAWEYVKSHTAVRLSIDIFQMGIVFFKRELSKEHYKIRF